MSISVSAFAADATDGKITVTPPTGTAADAENTYTLYKVFAATTDGEGHYSYTLSGSHTTVPTGFILDDGGNVYFAEEVEAGTEGAFQVMVNNTAKTIKNKTTLSDTDIANIAAYVTDADIVDTKDVTGTASAVFDGLAYGYYYVSTTTGSLVVIDSTKPEVEVADKNSVPGLDKTITNTDKTSAGMAGAIDDEGKLALAELGKEVEYTAEITVGKGAIGYEFHDKMGSGLTFKGNDSVTVTAEPAVTGDWYTIKTTPDGDDTLTITFKDGIAVGTKITIKYIGTVNSDALTVETGKNTARVDYGDENSTNHTPDSETNVYNAKVNVTKTDGDGAALEGAGFKLKNTAGKWYKNDGTTVTWVDAEADGTEIRPVKGTQANPDYDADAAAAAAEAGTVYDVPETISGTTAVASFTGLVNGTYTLVETTVPTGYNKAADSTVTIADTDFNANVSASATVVNNQGTELPSTGGIGTTIFYVVGSILVVAAGVLLITKKRMSREG